MTRALPLVTLTTDFGLSDAYVAAMKGVIYSVCPQATIVDLSHEIPPQDILSAAFFLAGSIPYFPSGTIHVCVVDPGVGTTRKPIAVAVNDQYVVCPDNGILTLVIASSPYQAHEISDQRFMRSAVSSTFHGRDIFAPAAARLASGAALDEAGARLDHVSVLDLPQPELDSRRVRGQVIHIDHFGNCITNIPRAVVTGAITLVSIGTREIETVRETYGDVGRGEALALFSSTGHLEIAVREGNASEQLSMVVGDTVEVTW